MSQPSLFKWRHFEAEIMLLCLRWYVRYALSYRDLEELMRERGRNMRKLHPRLYRAITPRRDSSHG